ncbi:MAG: glucose 1-dehydrogenase [Candidatus Micrarchaeales archaeon]
MEKSLSELFNIKGNVAIVTGASSGLGVLFAETLAEAGANLAICARRIERVEEIAKKLEKDYKVKAFPMKVDVNNEEEVKKFVEETYKKFGRIDILVNNAGIASIVPSLNVPKEDFSRVIDTNLISLFIVAREVAKYMQKRKYGKIINIASIYGQVGDVFPVSSYYASKGGVINLTRALAVEWAEHNIYVNAIAPGFFPSEMTKDVFENEEYMKHIITKTPLRRPGRLEDLKGVLLLLASHASDYITGQTIFVDGGWTIW